MGTPVPFKLKDGEVVIHPVLVKDANRYDYAKQILLIDKNKTNDINVLQMSDLEYLLTLCLQGDDGEKELVQSQLGILLSLCLHEENIVFGIDGQLIRENNRPLIVICDDNRMIKAKITPKEFDTIKKIILFQNDKDYDDTEYSADMQEQIELWIKVKNQHSKSSGHIPTLEEKKALLMAKNGMTEEQINNIRYRLFEVMAHSAISSDEYIGEMIIKGSYKYDVKENIEHPIYREKKSLYEQAFVDADSFASGMGGVAK